MSAEHPAASDPLDATKAISPERTDAYSGPYGSAATRPPAKYPYEPPRSWDDPRVCQRCVRTEGSYHGPPTAYVILNARTGKYHASAGYGMTDCGIDATGDEFLWPI
jgi:hypothetical protein